MRKTESDYRQDFKRRSEEKYQYIHPVFGQLAILMSSNLEQLIEIFAEAVENGMSDVDLLTGDRKGILSLMSAGSDVWSGWRNKYPNKKVLLYQGAVENMDLSDANLESVVFWDCVFKNANLVGANLRGAYFVETKMSGAHLIRADLSDAHFVETKLVGADLSGVTAVGTDFTQARLEGSHFDAADLSEANFMQADLSGSSFQGATALNANFKSAWLTNANFSGVILNGSNLEDVDARGTNFSGAKMRKVNLDAADASEATFVGTSLERSSLIGAYLADTDFTDADLTYAVLSDVSLDGAILRGARVYGLTSWNIDTDEIADQLGLVVTESGETTLTVNSLDNAKLVFDLMQDQSRLARMTETTTSKLVFLLGSFNEERMKVMQILAEAVLAQDRIPIIFDFEANTKDWDETVNTFARLSGIIIPDLTAPGSVPQELKGVIEGNPRIVIQPVVQRGTRPYSMFEDHFHPDDYPQVLPTVSYDWSGNEHRLMLDFIENVIEPAKGWSEKRKEDFRKRRKPSK